MYVIDHFNVNVPSNSDAEISLLDIFQFVEESWRLILGAGIVGLALGLGGWFAFANYKAELLLHNNNSFDILSWNYNEKLIPSLAREILEKKAVPDNQTAHLIKVSNPIWWSKNVKTNFVATKSELKKLDIVFKDMEIATSNIVSFSISVDDPSEENALEEVGSITRFIINASYYLVVKKILSDYEINSLNQNGEIKKKIYEAQVELGYLRELDKNLQQLQKSYPDSMGVRQQSLQLPVSKDQAKFLPLANQITAVKIDIAKCIESLERFDDQMKQLKTKKFFLESAVPIMAGRYDGANMINDLLALQQKLRAKIAPGDTKAISVLNSIEAEFLNVNLKFHGLQQYSAPIVTKPSMLKSAAIGFFGAGFAMLVVLLGRQIQSTLRSQRGQQKSAQKS